MRRAVFIILCLLIGISLPAAQSQETKNQTGKETGAGKNFRYYRIDSVKTITGSITEVKAERSFHRKDFTVLYVKEKESGKIYRVEVAPQWFFHLDLVKGSRIKVEGSFTGSGGSNEIMTRSITFQGKQHHFRDSSGFPMWRGKNRGKYRQRGNRIKGGGRGPGRGKGRGGNGGRGM